MSWEKTGKTKEKTLGQQYIEKLEKNPGGTGYEAREVITQYGLDKFGPELEDIMKKHKDYATEYYIWIVSQDIAHFEAKKISFVVRRTKPFPKWETVLLHYSNRTGDLLIKWVLPTKEGGEAMLENADGWDPLLIQSIQEHFPSLQAQQKKILSGHQKTQAQKAGLLTQLASSAKKK